MFFTCGVSAEAKRVIPKVLVLAKNLNVIIHLTCHHSFDASSFNYPRPVFDVV